MKAPLFFLVGLLLIAGCAGTPKESNLTAPPANAKTTPERSTPTSLPPEYNTQALRALGYPFEKPIAYKVVGLPDPMTRKPGPTKTGGREVKISGPTDGKLHIDATWTGGLSSLKKDSFTADKSGVVALMLQGGELTPSTVFLPAELRMGFSWKSKFSFTVPDSGQKLDVDSVSTVSANETISVPLGKFDTIVVNETWKIMNGSAKIVQTGRTWFAEGYGMVRTESVLTQTQPGSKPYKISLSIAAIPPKGK